MASLTILERTGILIEHAKGRELLRAAGATIEGKVVHIPPALVERALTTVPHSILLVDRDGQPALMLAPGHVNFLSHSDGPNIVDPSTQQKRPFLRQDGVHAIRLADYLPHMDVIGLCGAYSDVPAAIAGRTAYLQALHNTTKPIACALDSVDELEGVLAMALRVAGGAEALRQAPHSVLSTGPTSPLVIPEYSVEHVFRCADRGVPIAFAPMPCAGATGPVTLAGNIALGNAECLAGLVLSQLRKPGTPMVFGGLSIVMDMRTTLFCYAAPDSDLMVAAWTQMANHYGLPMWGTAGCTDSKVVDEQAALEAALQCLLALLSGASLVHDVGLIESGKTLALEMMVIANEAISMAKHITQGFRVDDDTLALDAIDRAGPGGHFLADEHTLRHFRDVWFPTLIDRSKRENWQEAGGLTLRQRATAKVREVLEGYEPVPLPASLARELAALKDTWHD